MVCVFICIFIVPEFTGEHAGRVKLMARIRDPFSGVSHFVGAGLALIGLVVLSVLAWGQPTKLAAFAIYGAGAIVLYLASAIYHSIHSDSPWPQRFDHMAIYVMIAGTYTPVCLVALPGPLGYTMLAIEWSLAAFGVAANIWFGGGPAVMRVVLYLGMGWLAVIAIPQLRAAMPADAVTWLLAGGILYSLGTVVYATERPRLWPGRFGAHDLWHVFVLVASWCHFAMMLDIAKLG
jgi:hemolysin III